jgi:hypothetical protein
MNIELVREIALPMDIILTGTDRTLSLGHVIEYGQIPLTLDGKPSMWSHAMLYYNEALVLESTITLGWPWVFKNGVQFASLDSFAGVPRSKLVQLGLSPLQREKVLMEALRLYDEGKTYPIGGLFGSLLTYWVFQGMGSNPLQSKHSLYCSAYVQESYDVIQVDFDPRRTARNTAPELISQYRDARHTLLN